MTGELTLGNALLIASFASGGGIFAIGRTALMSIGRAIAVRLGFAQAGVSMGTAGTAIAISPKIYQQLEKQLMRDGPKSIHKALRTAEKTLQAHIDKLPGLQYKSQVEGTIENVRRQIATLRQFISDKGL